MHVIELLFSGKRPTNRSLILPVFLFSVGWLFAMDARAIQNAGPPTDTLTVIQLLDSGYNWETVNSDSALWFYEEAGRVSSKIGYRLGEAKALHYSGIVYSDKSMYPEALQRYRAALVIYQEIGYARGIGACYTNMGNVYRYQTRLDSALFNYQKALEIFRDHKQILPLSQAYGNVGGVFQLMQQYQKGYEYHVQSVEYAVLSKDSLALCLALINEGSSLNDMKKLDESADCHRRAKDIAESIGSDYGLQLAHINLSDYHKQRGEYTLAIEHGLKSLEYAIKLETPFDVADVRKRVGDIYAASGDYVKATTFYLDAIEMSKGINAREITMKSYEALQEVTASLGQYQRAYDYQELAQQYRDSVLGEKQLRIINELEVKYQSLQKDQQLSQRQLELQKSKQYVVYSLGGLVVMGLIILLLIIHVRNRRRNHARELLEVEREKEINVLQALMQGEEKERVRIARALHDEVSGLLAATKMHLNGLRSDEKEISISYNQALNLLDEASATVRKTAHNLMPEILMQHGLDKALQRYCGIVSNDKLLSIQYDSWGEIGRFPANFELSVYRIVQELINNIIRHAGATEALVQLSCQNYILSVTVEDNGVGFSFSKSDGNGTGIASLRSRVQALNGKIDMTAEAGSGVSAYLEFDIRTIRS